ncbi:MAG: GTP 3',8-cyclase MoaA [Thermoproteota archaeon]|nr:MAG: GTP 3',8-cyclase MoaA [Candidatus Korarchaeota archaeon]
MPLVDRYGRPVTSLRVSVTQRCNLKCIYCHREGELNPRGEMELEEVTRLVKIASELGMTKVKLTGGEPLVRRDIVELVAELSSLPGVEEVSMVSNGLLLADLAGELAEAGLRRVNVSLDTLDGRRYRWVTGGGDVRKAIHGIEAAVEAGLSPVKVNMVLLKGVNTSEVWRMLEFTRRMGVILQLIELVSSTPGSDSFYRRYHFSLDGIEEELRRRAKAVVVRSMHSRRKYLLKDGGEVEVVKPMHNSLFCMSCSRLRLTSDGRLKPCLMRGDNLVDILSLMRSGASDRELRRAFVEAVRLREPYFKEVKPCPKLVW